jgi:hypothetical protein
MGMSATPMPPGPVAGTTIADFTTRLIAFVIDGVILGVINQIVWFIVFRFLPYGVDILVDAIIILGLSAGYFFYFWASRKQTPGMIFMKLQVVQDGSGAALTQSQAIRRWAYLGLPLALSTLLSVSFGFLGFGLGLGALAFLFTIAPLVALVAIGWEIYLAYRTSQDARKQGPHDKAVNSVVVSYGPSPLGTR